jgi:hypothetical protein
MIFGLIWQLLLAQVMMWLRQQNYNSSVSTEKTGFFEKLFRKRVSSRNPFSGLPRGKIALGGFLVEIIPLAISR